jgi:hypothetical protein
MAAFSSRGPTNDGRIKPDIVAPGTNIVSNHSPLGVDASYWGMYKTDGHYAYAGGTSQATPFAAGSAALIREWLQEKRQVPAPSAALIKAIMMNTAHDLQPGQYGTDPQYQEEGPRPNPVEGWGRVDLAAAIDPASPRVTLFSDETAGLQTGQSKRFVYHAQAGVPISVTLTWSDYPGDPSAAQALVNDLDLTVTDPNGQKLLGNGQDDHLNNAETVDVAAPVAGDYVVDVTGGNVPQGPQPYALAVSGDLSASGATPPPGVKGDVNGDGALTIADVTLALQAAVGLKTLTADQLAAALVAPDDPPAGPVTVADATILLRAVVGLQTL